MKRTKGKNEGITLIALVVTIIVLLILAGLTIALVSGENGLIAKAKRTASKYAKSAAQEELELAMQTVKIDNLSNGKSINLEIFTEASGNGNLNALENVLYNNDNSVNVELNDVGEGKKVLSVQYKKFEFNVNEDFSIEVISDGNSSDSGKSTSSSKYKIVPTVKASSISSLTLGYEIKEGNKTVDPERIQKVYYVCDKNADIDENMWKDSQKVDEFEYFGLLANTNYNVKIKAIVDNKPVYSDVVIGKTNSTEEYIAKMPTDFFTTDSTGETITGIKSSYMSGYNINYEGFDGTIVIPRTWNNVQVKKIGAAAFQNKYNAKKLYIEEGIETIDSSAFYSWPILDEVTLPTTLVNIGNKPFEYSTEITKATIPQSVINLHTEGSNSVGKKLKDLIPSTNKLDEINFNGKIQFLGNYAFQYCEKITTISIPSTVTEIKNNAFEQCKGLTEITIPGSVKTIGSSAFYYCMGMTKATIKSGVETIDSGAFYYCTKLANVEIEEGLKTINSQAFYGDSALVEISLPSTIETIGSGVFSYASGLTTININKAYDGNLAKTAPWGASSSITINWKQ